MTNPITSSKKIRSAIQWHNMGLIPEEIEWKFGLLSLAQIHAALAYYHARVFS